MTRIAIQFFGHLRTFKRCFPALKRHLLNCYDCDIFMHTWDVYNHNTQTWHKHTRGVNKTVNKDKIIKYLGIKDEQIIVEHQEFVDGGKFKARGGEFSLQGLKSVYRSIASVNALRENYQKKYGVKYDCVVCIRPDIKLLKKLDLNKYISLPDYNNSIYFGGSTSCDVKQLDDIGACDLLFFGDEKSMSKLCGNLKPLVKDGDTINHFIEGLLIDNITLNKLQGVFAGQSKAPPAP